MSELPEPPRLRRDEVRIPVLWLTLLLSLLIHGGLLLLPGPKPPKLEMGAGRGAGGPMTVRLAPRQPPPPAVATAAPQPAAAATPRRRLIAVQPPPRKVLATPVPAPFTVPTQPPEVQPPVEATDMASLVAARRAARGEEETPVPEDDNAKAARIIASNLAGTGSQGAAYDNSKGGGMFEVVYVGFDYAEFKFYGWNRGMGRDTPQDIELRKGDNENIRIAMVRRMIEIIRDRQKGDFTFESRRLGHDVTLSARLKDTKGLENFLMREFFDD